MIAKQTDCTISDICIDYFVKNNFNLFIERTNDESVNEWDWIAERTDLNLYATDPVRLIALYMIWEDWNNERKCYNQKITECIRDYGNTYNYAVDKLVQWGYAVSTVDDSVELSENYLYIAEKNRKKYSATDPLRLLGLVAIIQEYGEDWACSDVVRSFSVQPSKE